MKGISCFVGAAVALVCGVADVRGFDFEAAMGFKEALSQVKSLRWIFKAKRTNFSLDNLGIDLGRIVDVSYENLVRYATSRAEELIKEINGIEDPERKNIVKKYLMIVALNKKDFREAVIPNDENSNDTFFRINKDCLPGDEQAKATKISFIKTMLSEIINNPVGEARIKSLMLLYCLQQAGILNGSGESPLLETDSCYRIDGRSVHRVGDHVEVRMAKADEEEQTGVELLTGDKLVFYVRHFVPGPSVLHIGLGNKEVAVDKTGTPDILPREYDNLSIDDLSLNKILEKNRYSEHVRKFLAVSYIHELGHAYHKALGLSTSDCTEPQSKTFCHGYIYENANDNKDKYENNKYINILKYVVPLLNDKVFGDVSGQDKDFAENHRLKELEGKYTDIGNNKWSFWGDWDEMLTIFGINFYPDIRPAEGDRKDNIYIVEDWINENAARRCYGLSYQIGHNTSAFDRVINSAMNDKKNGYKQMVEQYYNDREIDGGYVISCNNMLRDDIIPLLYSDLYGGIFGYFDLLFQKLYPEP